jgi:hypothetical protein
MFNLILYSATYEQCTPIDSPVLSQVVEGATAQGSDFLSHLTPHITSPNFINLTLSVHSQSALASFLEEHDQPRQTSPAQSAAASLSTAASSVNHRMLLGPQSLSLLFSKLTKNTLQLPLYPLRFLKSLSSDCLLMGNSCISGEIGSVATKRILLPMLR